MMRDRSRKTERALCLGVIALLLMALTLVFFARWSVQVPADAVPVNQADAATFARTLGVDREIAARLAAYRDSVHGFDSVDQMLRAPLFASAEADRLVTRLPKTHLAPQTASAGQFAA